MDGNLEFVLREQPTHVAEIARLTGRSQTWVRENLKKHSDIVKCRKNEAGVNIFWIGDDKAGSVEETGATVAENSPENPVEQVEETEVVETTPTSPEVPSEPESEPVIKATDACPLCRSTAEQKQAGEEGTFLGACRTCPDCGKTYNAINGKEVKNAPTSTGKRVLLNPQHKIRAKQEAAASKGGSVRFDRNDRKWTVEDAKGNTWTFTAEQFAVETPESILARFA